MNAQPRLRIVNTILEDLLVFLADGPRHSSALAELLAAGRRTAVSSTVYRALHALQRHGLVERDPTHVMPAHASTIVAGALLRMSQGKDTGTEIDRLPGPTAYRLTAAGQVAATFVRERRKFEASCQMPTRNWIKFSRSMFQAMVGSAEATMSPPVAPDERHHRRSTTAR